ncbi:hypothetical protein VNI00_011357 [Paramarasmius palmivorus]|uniref:BTB domain-containing protein n=1 Tax=Paramarasmius palmivorus TaxID=297713 RepID=A0AAW0CBI6_9AGAR
MVLPTVLPENDVLSYKSLVEALLLDSAHTHIGDIDLPNEDRTMTKCSSLYASEPLFRAAFSQARFLNNSFRTLEPNLRRHGLKSLDSLDMNMFKDVAEAFHNEEINNDPNRIANARTIAQVYCDLLPVRVGRAANWRSLDRLRFIPAINEPERRGNGRTNSSLLDYVRRFPSIVAPNEVILEGYVAIAWTQRAILPTRPESIIIANPDFGVPTAQEIIRHLRALARYTAQNPKAQRRRVLDDLKATYLWLEEHHNEAQELSTHRDERLFLNIDDPDDLGSWSGKWIAADDLFFNIQDTGRSRGVRTFLKKFPNLLRVAGVAEVHDPVVPTANVSSVETLFNKQQALFERMRQEGQFLDVKFVEKDTNKEAWAHRVVLSTASDYFWSCFCASGLQECRTASKDDPVIVTMEEHTIESVNMVLDYIYTRSVPTVARSEQMDVDENFEGTELGRLLDAVRLAGYWQIEDLFEILQAAMIREKMITPYTVDSIFTVASQHGAHHLVKACEQFRNANQSVIEKIERRLS